MAIELATAYVSIIPSFKGAKGSISRELGGPLGQVGDEAGADAGKRYAGKFSKAAKVGLLGVAGGIAAVFKTGFDEAKDASAGTAQLTAGIKSTGNAAHVSVGGLNDLASSIQGYSGQTDDSIVAAEKLLLTFTNIKNSGPDKIFDQATVAASDMAAKMGGDASSNAILLGKALNDPVKGISALTRVGVSFTAGQKKQVAAMVKSGDTIGAQKLILHELNTEFGGAAKAAGQSLPGQLAIAKRSFEDVSQQVVTSLLPVITTLIGFVQRDFLPAFKKVADFFTSGSLAAKVIGGAILALTAILVINKLGTIAWTIATNVANVATKAWAAGQWLLNAAMAANPITLVILAIAALIAIVVIIATKTTWFQTIWKAVWGAITSAFSAAFNFIKDHWRLILAILTGPIGIAVLFVTSHLSQIASVFRSVWSVVSSIGGKIAGVFRGIGDGLRTGVGVVTRLIGGLIDTVTGLPGKITHALSHMWDVIHDAFVAAVNFLIRGWNSLQFKIPGFDPPGPGPKFGGFTLGVPDIPLLAKGTKDWPGGPAIVGDRGPEILNLPRHSQVIPNGAAVGSAGRGNTYHFHEAQSTAQIFSEIDRREWMAGAV